MGTGAVTKLTCAAPHSLVLSHTEFPVNGSFRTQEPDPVAVTVSLAQQEGHASVLVGWAGDCTEVKIRAEAGGPRRVCVRLRVSQRLAVWPWDSL